MDIEQKIRLCRIVGIMLLTDGQLLDEEVTYMGDLMDRLELSEDDRVEVMDRIDGGTEVLQDAKALREHGVLLLQELQDASRVDGIISASEVDLIQMIAKVLEHEVA